PRWPGGRQSLPRGPASWGRDNAGYRDVVWRTEPPARAWRRGSAPSQAGLQGLPSPPQDQRPAAALLVQLPPPSNENRQRVIVERPRSGPSSTGKARPPLPG